MVMETGARKAEESELGGSEGQKYDDAEAARKEKKGSWAKREASTLFINQIPYETSREGVKEFVTQVKEIDECDILEIRFVKDKNGKLKGMVFVEMSSSDKASLALGLDKQKIGKRIVNVSLSRPRKTILQERKEKLNRIKDQTVLSRMDINSVFEEVNQKTKLKPPLRVKDFDVGVQKYIVRVNKKALFTALQEFCLQLVAGKKPKNRSSLFMSMLRKHGVDEPEKRSLKRKTHPESQEGVDSSDAGSNDKAALSIETVERIIKASAAPRRSKKDADGVRKPPDTTEPQWNAFNEDCLQAMQKLSEPQLKRILSDFYKSKNFYKIKDKSVHFLILMKKKGLEKEQPISKRHAKAPRTVPT